MSSSYLDSYSHDLRQRMQAIRDDLPDDVQQVRDEVKQLTDWKHYVRAYPQFVLPAVAVAAFALVPYPSKSTSSHKSVLGRQSTNPNDDSSSGSAHRTGSSSKSEETISAEVQQSSIISGLASAAMTMAAKSAINFATQYGSRWVTQHFEAARSPQPKPQINRPQTGQNGYHGNFAAPNHHAPNRRP